MKFAFLMFFSLSCFSATLDVEKSVFNVYGGKLHTGGRIEALVDPDQARSGVVTVKLKYAVRKKIYVPVPQSVLNGDEEQDIPESFLDERGYLELESKGSSELEKVTLIHQGRFNLGKFLNCHKVLIKAKNGKSSTTVYFHPSLKGLGWKMIELVLHTNIPALGDYLFRAENVEDYSAP